MKKVIAIFVCVAFASGCAYIPWLGDKSSQRPVVNKPVLSKSQAIQQAKNFVTSEGLDSHFIVTKPHKIKRLVTWERDPHWVWRIHFPDKNRSFWKFWKRAPLLVEVDAQTGEIRHWGKR